MWKEKNQTDKQTSKDKRYCRLESSFNYQLVLHFTKQTEQYTHIHTETQTQINTHKNKTTPSLAYLAYE